MRKTISSREVIKILEQDGWVFIGATGDHHHFKHPTKPGKITVPHPVKDIHLGTLRKGILARASIDWREI